MDLSRKEIVAKGTWLYDGSIPCRVVIVKEDFIPGSGDHEDPPDVREDRAVDCVAVWYEAVGEPGVLKSCGGYYLTLEKAKEAARKRVGPSLRWE